MRIDVTNSLKIPVNFNGVDWTMNLLLPSE